MTAVWTIPDAAEAHLALVAEVLALKLRRGDVIALRGDLGAGKTTFARALIRALLGDPDAEVASPTFPLVQAYDTPRMAVAHFDLYRLNGPDDLEEIGFADAMAEGLTLVEWPERAETALPAERIEIAFAAGRDADHRHVVIEGRGMAAARVARLARIYAFVSEAVPDAAGLHIAYLQGDASTRAYARLEAPGIARVLMDAPRMPDGPPVRNGLPYSRIAHLAEDVRPFVAIGRALQQSGVTVPHIHAADLDAGLLLLDDLGDLTFGRALSLGHDQSRMWLAAVDVLAALRARPLPAELPLPDGTAYRLPRFDRAALEIEIGLILDWYWPAVKGAPCPDAVRADFMRLWSPVLDRILAEPAGLFLRDFHSPNLFWLPERAPPCNVGIIDFQDALAEHWSYDLASLLQDARVDVAAALETAGFERYCATVAAAEPDFDRAAFRAAYAAFGLQRNTRLAGLWVRLLQRDGKPHYLQHMPRTWDYIARNLAHPALADLKGWYDRHFPEAVRRQAIAR